MSVAPATCCGNGNDSHGPVRSGTRLGVPDMARLRLELNHSLRRPPLKRQVLRLPAGRRCESSGTFMRPVRPLQLVLPQCHAFHCPDNATRASSGHRSPAVSNSRYYHTSARVRHA